MSGWKRAPSSLVKKATAIGRRVVSLGLVQRAHDFQPGQHAVIAVIAAAGAHRVDVAAGHHRREVLGAGANADHVADGIDAHVEARRLHPADHKVAAGLVLVGEGQPRAAAAVDGADLGQFVERAEQALFIDTQHDFPNDAKTLDLCTGRRKISRAGDPDCLATA